jgi:hypothetical protein
MSAPPIGLLPDPINLVTASNLASETSLQYSSDNYYFALSSDTSGTNLFDGPIVIQGVGASVRIVDTGDNNAVVLSAPAVGEGNIFLNSTSTDANTNSIGILAGATPGSLSITSIGPVAPGNILNYNPTGSLVQLGNVGGIVQINGVTGLGQVYDEINNPILLASQVVTIATYNGAFGTITDISYNPPKTGYYLVTYTLTVNGAGISWGTPNGSAVLNTGLTLTQGSLVFITNSTSAFYGIEQGALTDSRQLLVSLTGGVPVFNDFQGVGTPNAGASGGLVVTIQPFA